MKLADNTAHLSSLSPAIIWLNILIQLLFPLACAFTPTIAASASHKTVFQASETTQVYTLKSGETCQDVARRFGISMDALRKLNQFRTLAHGFDHLQAGDEIDVPSGQPHPASQQGSGMGNRQHRTLPPDTASSNGQDEAQRNIAGTLSRVGTSLSPRIRSQREGDLLADMAVGMAASQASSEVENWMQGVGNARIQVNPDRHLSLRNAQADILVPLWEPSAALLFIQTSLHRSDERLQSNQGLGWRYFARTWMAGANTFFDYDYTARHARGGLGLEYWRDNLKLSTNTYFRLSSWRNSRALEDYEERPANGWDVRAEAWLPAYPQLGGKLIWEQYYGQEVGISSASERQEDPHRVTAGLSWTPVPLLTLTAERSLGGGGGNDARLGVEFRWQPGESLRRQLDGSTVGYQRSLAGSRYDFISRNNDIVLEYRKKQVVFLSLPEQLSGHSGTTIPLHSTVRAEHGLDHITWQADRFSAAGGIIKDLGGGDFQLTLPAYKATDGSQNTWTLSAVATDKRGNISSPAQTRVTIIAGQISVTQSSFMPAESHLPADGHTTQVLTLTLVNDAGQPVDLSPDSIALRRETLSGSETSASLSSLKRHSPGVYTLTLTAGTQSGSFRLIPVVSGQSMPSASVHVTGKLDPGQSSLSAMPETLTANEREISVVRFVARDVYGETIDGMQNVSFSLNAASSETGTGNDASPVYTLSPVVSAGLGVYTTTLKGRKAGIVTLRPLVAGHPVGDLSTQVRFHSDITSGTLVAFTRDRNEANANGTDEIHLRASVRDAQGNPVANQSIRFISTNHARLSADTVVTDATGDAEVRLSSMTIGESVVTATFNTRTLTQTVRFVPDGNSAQIPEGYMVVLHDGAVADGVDTARVGLLVTDKQYNPLPGVRVKLLADHGAGLSDTLPITDSHGEIYVTLTNTTAGTVSVTAQINDSRRVVPVHFQASQRTPIIVRIQALNDNVPADGHTPIRVQATITDVNGNLLPGVTVGFSRSGNARLSSTTGQTNNQGQANVEVRALTAGTVTLTAFLGGNKLSTDIHFVADWHSARISRGHLVVLADQQPVGGHDRVGVLVTDTVGNPFPGIMVTLSATMGATVTPAHATTDEHGEIYSIVSSARAGTIKVTAMLDNGSTDSTNVSFVADTTTAQVTALRIVSGDAAPADNRTPVHLQVTVQDQHGNPVAHSPVRLSADAGITLSTPGGEARTDDQGHLALTAVSPKAGAFTVRAKADSGTEKTQTLHFIAALRTLRVRTLTADVSRPADGASPVTLTARVQDELGNPAPDGVYIHFILPAAVLPAGGSTQAEALTAGGQAVLKVVSSVDGIYTVRAGTTPAGNEATASATFLADVAHVRVTLRGAATARVGLGVPLTATVTDRTGRAMADMAVVFTVVSGTAGLTGGVKHLPASTDARGHAGATLTDTAAGDNRVTVTLASGATADTDVAFVKNRSPALKAPPNVTMIYNADLSKSIASTATAITGGNGGTLHIQPDNDAISATLATGNKVTLVARTVPSEPVNVTVTQDATTDTDAPTPVTFTVVVNRGSLPDLMPKFVEMDEGKSNDAISVSKIRAKSGYILGTTLAYTSADTTIASVDGNGIISGGVPGQTTVTVTEKRANYYDKQEVIKVLIIGRATVTSQSYVSSDDDVHVKFSVFVSRRNNTPFTLAQLREKGFTVTAVRGTSETKVDYGSMGSSTTTFQYSYPDKNKAVIFKYAMNGKTIGSFSYTP